MDQQFVPRRSALYMPGSNARAIAKARELPVDSIILDLEDSVADAQKELARSQACAAVATGGFGHREVVIRVNGETTPWHESDVRSVLLAAPAGIVLPKVESPAFVKRIAEAIEKHNPASPTKIWCMLETPRGILACNEILQAHPRLTVAVMGTSDLTRDLRALHTAIRLPLITSLGLCLLAARAHGVCILDGVHLNLEDESGFVEACQQGRELGFDGKTLIHPKQISACNAAFSPTPEEVESAKAIVSAYASARERGQGVVVVSGHLVEKLHVLEAKRLLGIHQALPGSERLGGDTGMDPSKNR
jgi:citrate lyase subunit beta/citryl-CoA lyase